MKRGTKVKQKKITKEKTARKLGAGMENEISNKSAKNQKRKYKLKRK